MSRRLLILGGTAEARELAAELHSAGLPIISSLAGRVARPRLPVGEVRSGGFGGPDALARWLVEHAIAAVIDATHPFAERISASAAAATASARVPLLRLERPGWVAGDGDRWQWVDDLPQAAAAVRTLGAARVLLTTGRQGLGAFSGNTEAWFLIRCVDPPDTTLPPRHEVLLDRGPYTLESELALVDEHDVDLVVAKNSGGPLTEAKLQAARLRALPVVVVRRPPRLPVATVRTAAEAGAWARRQAAG